MTPEILRLRIELVETKAALAGARAELLRYQHGELMQQLSMLHQQLAACEAQQSAPAGGGGPGEEQ